jgi:hypothetical protein
MTQGMYWLIRVEPKGGLPPVDKEFYVVQGEYYSEAGLGRCLGRHPRGGRSGPNDLRESHRKCECSLEHKNI